LENNTLKRQFELENNGDLQINEAYIEALRSIWLSIQD
jgi:hypothetical protein